MNAPKQAEQAFTQTHGKPPATSKKLHEFAVGGQAAVPSEAHVQAMSAAQDFMRRNGRKPTVQELQELVEGKSLLPATARQELRLPSLAVGFRQQLSAPGAKNS